MKTTGLNSVKPKFRGGEIRAGLKRAGVNFGRRKRRKKRIIIYRIKKIGPEKQNKVFIKL